MNGMESEHENSIRVSLSLRVENNSKFVRGKTKVRWMIESFILSCYGMEKSYQDGWTYTLTIPHRSEEELDTIINDILREMDALADRHCCFIEADVTALDSSQRYW